MALRLFLLLALLPLAACGSDTSTDRATGENEYTSNETTSGETPEGEGGEAAPTREAGPNEVLYVEADEVGVVTVESGDDTYDVNVSRMELRESIAPSAVSPEALEAWLARFAPLAGQGTYADVMPSDVQADYTAVVTFIFVDDSGRTLFLQERPDGVAVVSQPDGPVWRLAPEAYRSLVPLAADLIAN